MDQPTLNMINLYIFNETSRATIYGIGTYIRELIAALKDSDINVCVIHLYSDKKNEKIGESEEAGEPKKTAGIRHIHIPPPINPNTSFNKNKQYELYYKNVVYLLRIQIKDTERLVFHLNSTHSKKLAEELKKAFDCRIVAVAHYANWGFVIYDNLRRLRAILNEEHSDDFSMNLKKSIEAEKTYYSKADHVICLSNYMREILCGDYGLETEKIDVIPNGLTNDAAASKPDVNYLRKKWYVPLNEKIIIFVGRMDEAKGLTYLIKSFRDVLRVYPRSRLVIAGEGAYDKYTKETQDVCTRISYTGFLDKPQLYEWYRLADVGVIPSLFEPFGYVAVEMMMHGLPILATATSGLNEVVDKVSGMKIPIIQFFDKVEVDTELLAKKIVYLLGHPEMAKRLGNNARKRYKNQYSEKVFHKNMLNFYQSLFSHSLESKFQSAK